MPHANTWTTTFFGRRVTILAEYDHDKFGPYIDIQSITLDGVAYTVPKPDDTGEIEAIFTAAHAFVSVEIGDDIPHYFAKSQEAQRAPCYTPKHPVLCPQEFARAIDDLDIEAEFWYATSEPTVTLRTYEWDDTTARACGMWWAKVIRHWDPSTHQHRKMTDEEQTLFLERFIERCKMDMGERGPLCRVAGSFQRYMQTRRALFSIDYTAKDALREIMVVPRGGDECEMYPTVWNGQTKMMCAHIIMNIISTGRGAKVEITFAP